MSRVLVTGGAGFIGSNLCKKLIREGNQVIAVDNFISSDGSNLQQFRNETNFKFVKHDITLPFPKTVNGQLSMVNCIYHLACPTGVPNLIRLAEEMLKTCSQGTLNVLELARKSGARLVFASSSEIYGDPEVFPQDESYSGNVDPIGIRSPYEEGKRFAESLIISYVRKYNLDAKIIRVFNTYGPGSSKSESRVVSKFLRLAKINKKIPVEGDGSQTRTFCYVDDLVDALILVDKRGKRGQVYNAGGETEISILELAKLIIAILGSKSKIEFVRRPEHDHQARRPDLSKIKSLGWHQTTGIYEGLKKTIQV